MNTPTKPLTPTSRRPNSRVWVNWPESDLAIHVVGEYFAGDPGQTSGPPERCYPPEPAEFEIYTATITILPDGELDLCTLPEDFFSESFWNKLTELAEEQAAEAAQDSPEPDDYYRDSEDWYYSYNSRK